jgi:hypothetical protein
MNLAVDEILLASEGQIFEQIYSLNKHLLKMKYIKLYDSRKA